MRSDSRARGLRAPSAVVLVVLAGCTQVLGLDPPRRDPCADGCVEPPVDTEDAPPPPPSQPAGTSAPDAKAEDTGSKAPPSPDANAGPPDAGSIDDAPTSRSFRCGASATCNVDTEACCATHAASGWVYTVTGADVKCPGVPIGCAQPSDCPGALECCTGSTFQGCVTRGTCGGIGFVTCDPALQSADCPGTTVCLHYADPTIPYYYCH